MKISDFDEPAGVVDERPESFDEKERLQDAGFLLSLHIMLKWLFLLLAAGPLQVGRSVRPAMTVLESEQREGYVCQLVEYNVSREERVQSYLLIPDGAARRDRRPGLVLLHDHGARFDIGKEKLVRPLPSAPDHIKASAQQ